MNNEKEQPQLEFGEEFQLPQPSQSNVSGDVPEGGGTPEKKKRGPKVGTKYKKKGETEKNSGPSEKDFFDSAKKLAEEKAGQEKARAEAEKGPSLEVVTEQPQLVTGYMLLVVCDAFIPTLVARFIAKKTGNPKKKMKKLDKDQMNDLKPLADAAAKKMFANVSEVPAFFIAYGAISITNNLDIE